jgi:PII-like signaling protein
MGKRMKGYQLEFFTQQDLFHNGKHLSDWLVETARSHGIRGATVFMGTTGFGRDHRLPSTQLFNLIDHPIQITMIVNDDECERLLALLRAEKLHLFYVKLAVEFGTVGD